MRTGYMGWADPALVANSGTSSPFLLLGDHAGREVPPELADGPCFVQLAMPRIAGDAVPSQPLYFPLAPGAGDST